MDNLDQNWVPKAWRNARVEIELHVSSSDPEDYEKRYGPLVDVNDLGAVVGEPFYPWTSIKAMTHQPDTRAETTEEEIDEIIGETDEELLLKEVPK